MKRLIAAIAVAFAMASPVPAAAAQQTPTAVLHGEAGAGWSALAAPHDLAIGQALTWRLLPGLLTESRPAGVAWTPENPAGLGRVISDGLASLSAGFHSEEGEYRRPLDPGALGRWVVRAGGESPLGESAAFIGRIHFEEGRADPGAHSILRNPYDLSPYTLFDTLVTPQRRQQVRVEGAGSRDLGPVSAGVALGFEAASRYATLSRVPQRLRLSRPAAVIGLEAPVGGAGIVVGVRGRWAGETETLDLAPLSGSTLVTRTSGYQPPEEIAIAPGRGVQYLRKEIQEQGVGANVAGGGERVSWHAMIERSSVRERVLRESRSDAPTDDWDADVTRATAGLRIARADTGSGVVLRGEWMSTQGETPVYEANASRIAGVAEYRHAPVGGTWSGRATLEVAEERRERGDPHPEPLRSAVRGRTLRAGGEVATRVHAAFRLAGGYWLSRYSADGAAPVPASLPPGLRSWVGGELAHAATRTTGHTLMVVGQFSGSPRAIFEIATSWSSVAPRTGTGRYPLQPDGSRSLWTVELRTVLR